MHFFQLEIPPKKRDILREKRESGMAEKKLDFTPESGIVDTYVTVNLYNPRNRITDRRHRNSVEVEHGLNVASRHVAAVILLELGTCALHQTDTSGIVHQSYNATCLVISVHKSEIKVRSLQRTGRSRKQLPCAIHGFLRKVRIHRMIDCAA